MEKKILNAREVGQLKRTYQNMDADITKVNKINAKIEELQKEASEIQQRIDYADTPWYNKVGCHVVDLVEKIITPMFNEDGTPKLDSNGRQIKVTKFVLKYPDTIIPTPTNVVSEVMDITPMDVPGNGSSVGSDFDIDSDNLPL